MTTACLPPAQRSWVSPVRSAHANSTKGRWERRRISVREGRKAQALFCPIRPQGRIQPVIQVGQVVSLDVERLDECLRLTTLPSGARNHDTPGNGQLTLVSLKRRKYRFAQVRNDDNPVSLTLPSCD